MRFSMRALTACGALIVMVAVVGVSQWSYAGVKRRLFGPTCATGLVKVAVDADGQGDQHAACIRIAHEKGRPLLVNLHQWSADFTEINEKVLHYAVSNDLNLIVPNLHGPNDKPQACGSDHVMQDLDQAIAYMSSAGNVADAKVVVLGVSGGGYTALHHLYRGKARVDYYSIWVPITDLSSWYKQSRSRNLKYAQDIEKCTGLDAEEMKARSPMTYAASMAAPDTKVLLATGIHDGHGPFAVPISHSLNLFDIWAAKTGADPISAQERSNLLTLDYDRADPTDPARALLTGKAGNVDLLVFDGGHEILEGHALSEITKLLEPPAS